MGGIIDLVGQRFGNLTVLKYVRSSPNGHSMWECICDCGTIKTWLATNLKRPGSHMCNNRDCEFSNIRRKNRNIIHGKYYTYYRYILNGIIQRCTNKNSKDYYNYGARGITIDSRWLGEDRLLNFIEDMGGRPGPNYSIDRIDPNGPYSKSNCRWATSQEQSQNVRTNTFTPQLVKYVLWEYNINNLTVKEIKEKLNLTCSDQAIYRVVNRETWTNVNIDVEISEYERFGTVNGINF